MRQAGSAGSVQPASACAGQATPTSCSLDGADVGQVTVKLGSPKVETAAREFIIEFNKRVREYR